MNDDPNLDYVDHPTLGRLSFPKDMPPDERNAAITRAMAQRGTGLSPEARQLSPAGQAYFSRDRRSTTDKVLEFIAKPADYFTDRTVGAIDAAKSGQYAKATNEGIKAGSVLATPFVPEAVAAAPVTALRAIAGGYLAGKATKTVASAAGATPDQADLAENVGNFTGGTMAATGLIRAVLGSPTKAILTRAGTAASGLIDPDVAGLISPRLAHLQNLLIKAGRLAAKPSVTEVPEKIDPSNLIDQLRKGATSPAAEDEISQVTRRASSPGDDTGVLDPSQTYVRPSKSGTQQGIEDMLAAAKRGGSADATARVDAHKVAKTAIGEDVVASGEPGYGKSATFQPQPFFKQYPPPESPQPVSLSELRAAQSPEPPRSSLSKNQRQLAKYQASQNAPSDVAAFQEQAAQELFGKSFNDLPVNDPAARLRATMRAIELQTQARRAKSP